MSDKERVLKFINDHTLMVVSTLNAGGKSESAVVGFGETEDFKLIFGTNSNTRKAQNILSNGDVSVVIGWDGAGTVQYEGVARKLEGYESDEYSDIYFQKVPKSRRHKDVEGETYFLIEPKWLRFTEVAFDPWRVTELSFNFKKIS